MIQKISLRVKLFLIGTLPALFGLFFFFNIISNFSEQISENKSNLKRLDVSAKVTNLLIEVKQERILSRSLMFNKQEQLKKRFKEEASLTDKSLDQLKSTLKEYNIPFDIDEIGNRISEARRKTLQGQHSPMEVFYLYHLTGSDLNDIIIESLSNIHDKDLTSSLNTYFKLIELMEQINFVRGEVDITKHSETVSENQLNALMGEVGRLKALIHDMRSISDPWLADRINSDLNNSDYDTVLNLSDQLFHQKKDKELSQADIDKWLLASSGLSNSILKLVNEQNGHLSSSLSSSYNRLVTGISIYIILVIIAVLITLFFVIHTRKSISNSLKSLCDSFQQLSFGNTKHLIKQIGAKDEIHSLINSYERMRIADLNMAEIADQIGKGNYQVDLALRSENDVLVNALLTMRNNLIRLDGESQSKNWLLGGLAEFSVIALNYQNYEELAPAILSKLIPFTESAQGTFFLSENKENTSSLRMIASYACDKHRRMSKVVEYGEGLVGQAAIEKHYILLNNVPSDYTSIESSLVNVPPANMIILPLIYKGIVKGVIELASLVQFDENKISFLTQLSVNLAISLRLIERRIQSEVLLNETQEAYERMRTQEEELRVTNEELAAQTNIIRQSEEELRVQQEELMQANAALEEKTQQLEEHNESIKIKNHALEQAKVAIDLKAQELENTSRYKSEFLANMSHELRTPLNSMLILSGLMLENKTNNLNKDQTEYIKIINKAGQDLLNLINNILDLSKIESRKIELHPENFQISEFLDELHGLFREVASEKKIVFEVNRVGETPASMVSDRFRVEQILKNLLSNAFKFTEANGKVSLSVFVPVSGILYRNENLRNSKNVIGISVSDTGIGIPPEKQKLIFEAFQQADGTTSRRFGGTGLGLSISRELAILLGGEIQLESTSGKGSTFTIYLPLEDNAVFNTPPSKKAEPVQIVSQPIEEATISEAITESEITFSEIGDKPTDLSQADKLILVVEDEDAFAKVLVDFSHEKGFKTIVANRGDLALIMARKYQPHAIILDIGLPVMDGWTVIRKLKEDPDLAQIPVHIVSGMDDEKRGLEMGAVEYLKKPLSPDKIRNVFNSIEETIDKQIRKILIIEDNPLQQEALHFLLTNHDLVTINAETAQQGLELLDKQEFDAVILDLMLPDMDGISLLKKIRDEKKLTEIPVIVFTGKEISPEENKILMQYSNSIISKKSKSNERLLDEMSLFLRSLKGEKSNSGTPEYTTNRIINGEPLKGKKVLLVDDDMRNIFALSKVLEAYELNIVVANDGKEALEKLDEYNDVDLVLMDIMMPEMDGYEATARIRKHKIYNKLPVIALTAKAMKEDRKRCIDAGASDYISKPVDTQKLISMMRIWLHQ